MPTQSEFAYQHHYVVAHPGQAHLDDFIACSLIVAAHGPNSIVRRDPTNEELENPFTWVVDVGMRFQPHLRNFDHHQDMKNDGPHLQLSDGTGKLPLSEPTRGPMDSSASLVAKALGLDTSFFPWWEGVDRMDCTGPSKTAEWVGTTWDSLEKVSNPAGQFLVKWFGSKNQIERDDDLYNVMRRFGQSLFDMVKTMSAHMADFDSHAKIHDVAGHKWVDVTSLPVGSLMGFEIWVKRNCSHAAGTFARDDRGPGTALWRRNDHHAIDFTRCDPDSRGIIFIHKNGFCLKTTSTSLPDVIAIIDAATIRKG